MPLLTELDSIYTRELQRFRAYGAKNFSCGLCISWLTRLRCNVATKLCAIELDFPHGGVSGLQFYSICLNLSYMRSTLTISLPMGLRRDVSRTAKNRGLTESEFVRDALRRRLALDRFRSLRERAMAQARARGIYTDEDVFKIVS